MAARGTGKTISQLFSRLTPFPGNWWILLRGRGKKLYDEYCDHMMEAWRFLQSAITVGLDLLREFQDCFGTRLSVFYVFSSIFQMTKCSGG